MTSYTEENKNAFLEKEFVEVIEHISKEYNIPKHEIRFELESFLRDECWRKYER